MYRRIDQLETVALVQGLKEQALLNIATNWEHKNMPRTSWFDVKSVLDLIDHNYMIKCVEHLGSAARIPEILHDIIACWKIDIRSR